MGVPQVQRYPTILPSYPASGVMATFPYNQVLATNSQWFNTTGTGRQNLNNYQVCLKIIFVCQIPPLVTPSTQIAPSCMRDTQVTIT